MNEQNTINEVVEVIESSEAATKSNKFGKVAIGAGIALVIGAVGYGIATLIKRRRAIKLANQKACDEIEAFEERETTNLVKIEE